MNCRKALVVLLVGSAGLSCFAQPTNIEFGADGEEVPEEPKVTAKGYKVSSFEIRGRWAGHVQVPLKPGDIWSPQKQSEALNAIRSAFTNDSTAGYLLSQQGEAQVIYIDVVEEKDEASRTVKLTFRPFNIHVSLAKIGDNVLPIPRSPFATRYEAVPAPLLALNPTIGMSYDRAFGTALLGAFETDLLTLRDTAQGKLPAQSPHRLNLSLGGAKSFEDFHRANAGLKYSLNQSGAKLAESFLSLGLSDAREPLAGLAHVENAISAAAGFTLRLGSQTRVTFNAGYSREWDDLENTSTSTDVQPNRLVVDTLLPKPFGGFLRAAIWEDNGWTDEGIGSHQRLAGRIGYSREFPVAENQSIGFELIAGAGCMRGEAPANRRFFGGNSTGQFLYDSVSGPSLMAMPAGPLIRSFGESEADGGRDRDAVGGDAFWHVNLNLTLPIRRWSQPLIPQDPEIRTILKNGIFKSGRSFLITALKNQGMSREQAVAEADRTFNEIGPATEFIIDEANLYSVKPLLMFDAAGLSGGGRDATWLAAGGGLQLTIVTAKFEIGYMYTLNGPIEDDRGNFFARLVFQKLF